LRDIKDRFSELCIDKSLTFTSRATSPFSRGGKGVGGLLHFAKPVKRSFKGKGVGGFRGIVWFLKG